MDRYQKAQEKIGDKRFGKNRLLKGSAGRTVDLWKKTLDDQISRYIRQDHEVGELLLVPEDLQTTDPSLMGEIVAGHFGLEGLFMDVGEGHPSIFEAPTADDNFTRALLGFGWLRDLRASEYVEAQHEAGRLVLEWVRYYSQDEGVAIEPDVLACRITSFLSHSSFLLKGMSRKNSRRFMQSLSQQIALLAFLLEKTPNSLSRLGVLSVLVMAGLCLSQHNELLARVTPLFLQALDEQIFLDGGHNSRNPAALPEILFKIIPLGQCYTRRGQDVPEQLDKAIKRLLPMIRFFRLGDSSLVRFNGTSTTPTDALATLLAYDEQNLPFDAYAQQSGYCRVQDGPTSIVCDIGSPPVGRSAKAAHAGCLSFEMSVRHFAMVVNSGAFQGDDEKWQRFARSTMAHSTLDLDDHSSGGFDPMGRLTGPVAVEVNRADLSGLEAAHRGYEKQFGFLHRRLMVLSHEGLRLTGTDCLEGVGTTQEVSFHIRFHIHPLVELGRSDKDNLLLTLPDGEIWRFTAKGATIKMQDSVYLAYRQGPQPTHQIILTGTAHVGSKVTWIFEQYRPRPIVT